MHTALFIARRYLFSKKSHNLINVISMITMVGLGIGTAALIVVLSVFNGFEEVIKSNYNTFNPDFLIKSSSGKTISFDAFPREKLLELEGVKDLVKVVEEDVLFKYRDKQFIAKIKGVSENYTKVSPLDTMMVDGYFVLQEGTSNFAIVGAGVAYYLDINPRAITRFLSVYVPKRGNASSFNFQTAFNNESIHPSGVFSVQSEFDEKYVLVPLRFAKKLLDYEDEITALEIFAETNSDIRAVEKDLRQLLGDAYIIKNRFQQNEALFKVMRSEKTAIFLILVFILILSSFNMIGSISILIVEKLKDIAVLKSMGADRVLVRRIFFIEGFLISFIGSLGGLFFGFMVLWLQQEFGLLQLGGGEGGFIIDAYPVAMRAIDFVYVFVTVLLIGSLASIYPVRMLTRKYESIGLQ